MNPLSPYTHPGLVGWLPLAAWRGVVDHLSSPFHRTAVLQLRRACKALQQLVGELCVGGAGRLDASAVAQLERAPTSSLGRALVVDAKLFGISNRADQLAIVAAAGVAVRRGHMIAFMGPNGHCDPALVDAAEAILMEASRECQLLDADLRQGTSDGWSANAMARMSSLSLSYAGHTMMSEIMDAHALKRVDLWRAQFADTSLLSGLNEVRLCLCDLVEDLSPLADVPKLVVIGCEGIEALPAMRNDWLEIDDCIWLTDLSGLASGRVGRLTLRNLPSIDDLDGVIEAMCPRPRMVILDIH